MITVYQLPTAWGRIPSLGHFCVKVQTYLRMVELPYWVCSVSPRKAPKGKVPFIEDGGEVVSDSETIVKYLKRTYGDSLDESLTSAERASAHTMRRMLEEHTYFAALWFRWGEERSWPHMRVYFHDLLGAKAPLLSWMARRSMLRQLWEQGIARHDSDEILARGKADMDVVSTELGSKPYLLGDQPTSVDASAYGVLTAILDAPWDSPEAEHLRSLSNVSAYLERLRERYWAGWDATENNRAETPSRTAHAR